MKRINKSLNFKYFSPSTNSYLPKDRHKTEALARIQWCIRTNQLKKTEFSKIVNKLIHTERNICIGITKYRVIKNERT
jgi:hypothetical protein